MAGITVEHRTAVAAANRSISSFDRRVFVSLDKSGDDVK